MPLFDSLEPLAPMQKFQLIEQYLADRRPGKILAATGAYKNERGETPLFECVQIAEDRIREREPLRDYLEPAGYLPFCEAMQRLLFGNELPSTWEGAAPQNDWPIRTIHTPGGTAALRLGADLLVSAGLRETIWVSEPTWGNHLKVFQAAGLTVETYPYSVEDGYLDVDQLLASIEAIPDGDVLMLQASTHNPTCIDLTLENWRQLAVIVARRELIPFFDVAFFGFTDGLREDLAGLREILATNCEAIVATSLSKSFALYNRRVGTLSIVGTTDAAAENAFQHARHLIRANYSNPPLEGAALVAEILTDRHLFSIWERELERVRTRMRRCREQIARLLRENGVARDLSYITRERGLFSRLDLTLEQTETLRTDQAIYLTPTGRFNVTAIADKQMDRFCRCVSACLR
jgi:aspartate aminotransferase/aromatic-amino-acid transaminase